VSDAPLVLASRSPRRLALLRSVGFQVRVVPSRYDEPPHEQLTPRELALLHARQKGREVAGRLPNDVIVAADTVVDVDGAALGKPRDAAEAVQMLKTLSGRAHDVHTAFSIIAPGAQGTTDHVETTRVWFYELGEREIDGYVRSGDPMDKAGAYGIQGIGATLVRRIEGDFYTVMGFPLGRFTRTLAQLGLMRSGANQSSP